MYLWYFKYFSEIGRRYWLLIWLLINKRFFYFERCKDFAQYNCILSDDAQTTIKETFTLKIITSRIDLALCLASNYQTLMCERQEK